MPDKYTILTPGTDFDYLNEDCQYYDIAFRIVRIQASEGQFICLATNLPEEQFSLPQFKDLYRLRWAEETSFRDLKYTIGLINWHSRKPPAIHQELAARMILYNFCEMVTAHAVPENKSGNRLVYKINFVTAVNICRAYLRNGGDETEIMQLIQRNLTPVRLNRKYPMNLRPKRQRDYASPIVK